MKILIAFAFFIFTANDIKYVIEPSLKAEILGYSLIFMIDCFIDSTGKYNPNTLVELDQEANEQDLITCVDESGELISALSIKATISQKRLYYVKEKRR